MIPLVRCLIVLVAGILFAACSSAEPVPEPRPTKAPLEQGTSEQLSPPLGKPRPKLVPGDVVARQEGSPVERTEVVEEPEEPPAEEPERGE